MRWIFGAAVIVGVSGGLGFGYLAFVDCYDCNGRGPRTARVQLMVLDQALQFFYLSEGRYPTSDEGLDILCANAADRGPILDRVPEDPWGNRYEYQPKSRHPGVARPTYALYSLGPDEVDATEDDIALEP